MNQFQIRIGTEADMDDLVQSAVLMIHETEGEVAQKEKVARGVAAVLKDPTKGFYVVAESEDGRFAGSLFVNQYYLDLRAAYIWWIHCVHVRHEFRRRGIYGLMYELVKEQIQQRSDVASLRLLVHGKNEAAIRAYEKMGMKGLPYTVMQERIVQVET